MFMRSAIEAFADHGVKIQRVPTANGACYRSALSPRSWPEWASAKRTRRYRLQSNGKAECFNRILLQEWAYARAYSSESELQACYQNVIEHYNHNRPHSPPNGAAPISRATNVPG